MTFVWCNSKISSIMTHTFLQIWKHYFGLRYRYEFGLFVYLLSRRNYRRSMEREIWTEPYFHNVLAGNVIWSGSNDPWVVSGRRVNRIPWLPQTQISILWKAFIARLYLSKILYSREQVIWQPQYYIFGRHKSIDTPLLDFWWCLFCISKPEWATLLIRRQDTYVI